MTHIGGYNLVKGKCAQYVSGKNHGLKIWK